MIDLITTFNNDLFIKLDSKKFLLDGLASFKKICEKLCVLISSHIDIEEIKRYLFI